MSDDTRNDMTAIDPEAVTLKVRQVVAEALDQDLDHVTLDASFYELGGESLDMLDMAFMLEKEYRIQFPRTDILERAADHFGEQNLVADGLVTELGLKLLRKGMPELDPERIKPGLTAIETVRMINVASFVRITLRLLEVKSQFPRTCPDCGGALQESEIMPEFQCTQCQKIVPLPDGDTILLQDLIRLWEETAVGDAVPTS